MSNSPDSPDVSKLDPNVIALSRYRALLSRGRRVRKGDDLLSAPNPGQAVRDLPPDEFYYILAERGFPEAKDLLIHGSAEQVQTALDFALWDRDHLAPAKLEEWLSALSEAPDERICEWVRGLDIELIALILLRRTQIHEITEEPLDIEPQGTFFETPDGSFLVDLLGDDDAQRTTRFILNALYREDMGLARRLLVSLKGELDSDLEETAQRWRSGRMADLGFVDYYEALEAYRELDPQSVRIGEAPLPRTRPLIDDRAIQADSLRVPALLSDRLGGTSVLARAVAGVQSSTVVAEIHTTLVALANRVLAADRIEPGQTEPIAAALTRVQGTLDLALEFLARGDEALATRAVETVPLLRLHRLGVTLVGKVSRAARKLRRENPFARLGIDLFEAEDADALDTLALPRPLLPGRLSSPPQAQARPFVSLADLARATTAIEQAAAALLLLGALGVKPADLAQDRWAALGILDLTFVDAAVLARTALLNRLSGPPGGGFTALPNTVAASYRKKLQPSTQAAPFIEQTIAQCGAILARVLPTGTAEHAAQSVAKRWLETLSPLETVLVVQV